MKKNRIYLIIAAILVIISAWLIYNNTSGTIKRELKDFAVQDTAAITKIFLADKQNNSVLLEKEKPGVWKINKKYDVRPDVIKLLLYTIQKVDVKSPVGKNATANVLKFLSAQSVKCEIYQGDDLVKAYYVGGETQDQLGTYMLQIDVKKGENSASPFVTYIPGFDGYLTPRYFAKEYEWRDRVLFNYSPLQMKSVKLEFTAYPDKSYQMNIKGGNKFEITDLIQKTSLKNVDPTNVKQFLSYFRNVKHEGFESDLPKTVIDSVLATPPQHILTITDTTGKETIIKTFFKRARDGALDNDGNPAKYDADRMYAQVNGQDFVYVQFYSFGILLQPITYFEAKKT